MIEVAVPGFKDLALEHLVLDYNGTLAVDGVPVKGVKSRLASLADRLTIHVITADTFGRVRSEMGEVPCRVTILPPGDQAEGKLAFVRGLGPERVAAGGNGRNDRLMVQAAALGFAVILKEGAAAETLSAADVVFTGIDAALSFFNHPLRMTATLRS